MTGHLHSTGPMVATARSPPADRAECPSLIRSPQLLHAEPWCRSAESWCRSSSLGKSFHAVCLAKLARQGSEARAAVPAWCQAMHQRPGRLGVRQSKPARSQDPEVQPPPGDKPGKCGRTPVQPAQGLAPHFHDSGGRAGGRCCRCQPQWPRSAQAPQCWRSLLGRGHASAIEPAASSCWDRWAVRCNILQPHASRSWVQALDSGPRRT
mmetsp:Transcript_123840/g.361604  ORF Transcript_123840/g.361604 Transcript_123840/m.361604 type:complete len:209 (-) Transcript_123840:1017-1643(-)